MNILRPGRILLVAAMLTVIAGRLPAQSGLTIQLFQPPPNQLKIADLWRIKIVNNTTTTYTVCLFGTLDETGLNKRLVDATTAQFRVPPGTKIVSGSEIQPIDANYYDERYKQIFLRTGQAPAGEYRICVEMRADCGPQVLATDCKDQRVQPLTPPILISPPDESIVVDRQPSFSWLPPTPLRPGQQVRYQLKIVEILGRQSPYDALISNPAWFDRDGLTPTVFPYPISARAFKTGGRYAWQIKAFTDGIAMGESEIWWFNYKPGETDTRDGRDPRGGRDTLTRSGGGGAKPTSLVTGFKPGNRGTVQFNTEGDVRAVFGDPVKLQYDPSKGVIVDAGELKKKELEELLKELLRSCND